MVDEQIRSNIESLNEKLSKSYPFKLAVVEIKDLELLEKNARYMTNEMFRNLVENIKKDGGLSSLPFCWKHGDKYRVLSGNHRVMAAKEAGLNEIIIIYTDKNLSKQEQIAIQLSHNAIEGRDDPVILKELWEEIEDVNLKFYAGLDDKMLGELEKISLPSLSEVPLEYRTVSFVFLPEEHERLNEIFEDVLNNIVNKDIYLARFQDFDRLIESLSNTEDSYNIKNSAVALMLILDIFEKHQDDLIEGWIHEENTANKSWIPLSTILGGDRIPIESARIIQKAVKKMQDKGEVTKKNLWQVLEYWAADYLAGEE